MDNSARLQRQRRGLIIGGVLIAYGIVSSLIGYYNDSNSFNLVDNAGQFAILHVVLWTLAGLGVMAWYGIGPGSQRRNDADGDTP